jgi:hypothetical protein
MTDDDFPAGVGADVEALATAPLDADDEALLRELDALLRQADPVPDDLVERVQFALALDELHAEVAEMTRMPLDALAVRADPSVEAATTSLTFKTDAFTAMVTITRTGDDRFRLDGWVAPPLPLRVVARMQEGSLEVTSDDAGRFVVEDLPGGFAQLVFHHEGGAVVTPMFEL